MDNDRPFVNIGFDEAKKLYGDLIGEKRLLFYKIINLLVMNRHDADEIFQEAMLLGWENRHQLRTGPGFVAWMIKIIRSVAAKKRDLEQKDRRIWSVLFQAIQDSLPQRTHAHNPEGQMVSEEEKTVAMTAYERLPDTERIIYGLYHAEDYTQAEIGQMLDMPQETVRNHLHRAQGRLEKRMHSMVLAVLLEQLHYDSSSELVQQVIAKIAASPVPAETVAVTAAAGAGIAEKTALGGFFTTLALPFLWIASLLISGTASTTAFVRSMPTLQARRWLVKHLMIFYVGFVSVLVMSAFFSVFIRSRYLDIETFNKLHWILSGALFVIVSLYIYYLNYRYHAAQKNVSTTQLKMAGKTGNDEKFRLLIRNGLWLAFGSICLLWVFLAYELLTVGHKVVGIGMLLSILLLAFLSFGLHFGVVKLFKFFVEISNDMNAFYSNQYSGKLDYSAKDKTSFLHETFFVLPALCFFVGANVVHISIAKNTRVYSSVTEVIVYSLLWFWVIRQNQQFPGTRGTRILLMIGLQLLIFNGLRYFVY